MKDFPACPCQVYNLTHDPDVLEVARSLQCFAARNGLLLGLKQSPPTHQIIRAQRRVLNHIIRNRIKQCQQFISRMGKSIRSSKYNKIQQRTCFLSSGICGPSTVAVWALEVKVVVKLLHEHFCHRLKGVVERSMKCQSSTLIVLNGIRSCHGMWVQHFNLLQAARSRIVSGLIMHPQRPFLALQWSWMPRPTAWQPPRNASLGSASPVFQVPALILH